MKFSTQTLTRISMMVALTFIGGLISIPVGPVPIPLQTLFVLLTGFVLSAPAAFLAQLLHLLLALLIRGIQTALTPSFGFLIGFVAAASLIAWAREQNLNMSPIFLVLAGTLMIYLIGTLYMAFIVNTVLKSGWSAGKILTSGLVIFLPGDLIKGFAVVLIVKQASFKKITLA